MSSCEAPPYEACASICRAASYDPAGAGVKISGDDVAAKVTEDAFAADVAAAIDAYRAAEKGWTSFDHKPLCAEAVTNPATNTITLQPEPERPADDLRQGTQGRRSRDRRSLDAVQSNQCHLLAVVIDRGRAADQLHGDVGSGGREGTGDGEIHLDRRRRSSHMAAADQADRRVSADSSATPAARRAPHQTAR